MYKHLYVSVAVPVSLQAQEMSCCFILFIYFILLLLTVIIAKRKVLKYVQFFQPVMLRFNIFRIFAFLCCLYLASIFLTSCLCKMKIKNKKGLKKKKKRKQQLIPYYLCKCAYMSTIPVFSFFFLFFHLSFLLSNCIVILARLFLSHKII